MNLLIIIPTYNESENIASLTKEILDLNINAHILIVDDNSSDGTGRLADELSLKYKEVHVINRKGKRGYGLSCIEGLKYAQKAEADYIFLMDADFSHHPKYIPDFLEAIKESDLVIGSRYVHGISVINWGLGRLLLSKMATLYVKIITGLPVTDATSGFRCFRRQTLSAFDFDKITSNGYSFLIETAYKTYRKGFRIKEIPIVFEDRRVGKSKMNKKIILEAFWIVWKLQFEYLFRKY